MRHVPRFLEVAVWLLAAGLLAAGWPAAASARPVAASARPATTARPVKVARAAIVAPTTHPTCSKNASGRVTWCPVPVRSGLLPAAARDQAPVARFVADPARMVDTRTWSSGGGNTFPGADAPFGMIQWSPDTVPRRSDGGGYTYGDHRLTGYSLTHLSGPGCPAAGNVPILPMTGRLPRGNPDWVTTSFTNAHEVAQAGYYAARSNMPSRITAQFSATPHAAIGKFTFPRTSAAGFLIKLMDSETPDFATSARVVSRRQVVGTDTSGHFCNETSRDGWERYTVHFDILFNRPFYAARIIRQHDHRGPKAVFVRFNTTHRKVIKAKVAISYVSNANARLNRQRGIGGWSLDAVQRKDQGAWNALLRRIQVAGGSYARTQEFYSLLYKDLLQPNIISDVNGQYRGPNMRVHAVRRGHSEYGMFSGWDIYHALAQLQAIVDPAAASDMAQSLLNEYAENGILPQWQYLSLDDYIMVGDPADSIISDYYAFGARGFNAHEALTDMVRQATTVNRVRPGLRLEEEYGYLPQNGRYGCCHARAFVPSLLEYDTADFALAEFAAARGHAALAARLRRRADNWVNVFDKKTHLLTPRLKSRWFLRHVHPWTNRHYLEGSAEEYLWDVPNDYAGLFARLGGDATVARELNRYLSRPNGGGSHAFLSNEFDLGEQNALDYARDPAGTQRAVAILRDDLFRPGPYGLPNNDDLGGESSVFIWSMLGMYPENPGSDDLVLASPGFPDIVLHLANGKAITISAPGASRNRFYVSGLTVNGTQDSSLYVPFSVLTAGARMDWMLRRKATSWGSRPQNAPPSYQPEASPPG
jgi:predicted alpha-1,2-mannosidase